MDEERSLKPDFLSTCHQAEPIFSRGGEKCCGRQSIDASSIALVWEFVCSAKFRSKFCSLSRLEKASESEWEKKSIDRSSWEFESEFRFKFEFELMASGENEMERKVAWRHSTRSSWNWFKFNFFLKIRLQYKESLGAKWDFFDGSRKSLSNSLRLDFEFRRPKVLRFANKRAARWTRSFVRSATRRLQLEMPSRDWFKFRSLEARQAQLRSSNCGLRMHPSSLGIALEEQVSLTAIEMSGIEGVAAGEFTELWVARSLASRLDPMDSNDNARQSRNSARSH